MNFLAPIAGLIAGLAGSVLVILYWMLKLRRRPVKVSSTLLWKRAVRDMEGNIPWQRVRPSVLLFLQLLAVILLAIAIARPTRETDLQFGGEVAVILDVGASMNAVADRQGRTRLDLAKRDAAQLVRRIGSQSPSTRFRVIVAGGTPQMFTSASSSWRRAKASIESVEASDTRSDLDSAIGLANSITVDASAVPDEAQEYGEIIVFTDAPVDDPSINVQRMRVPQDQLDTRGNLGIVLLGGQRDQADPDRCRVFVTVAGKIGGPESGPLGVVVRARVDGMVLASKPMKLIPDQAGVVQAATTLSFDLGTSGLVEIAISRDDVLMSDNTAWVSMPDPAPVVTTVLAPDGLADPLLVDVLGAATGGLVLVVSPGEPISAGTGLVVFDRVSQAHTITLPSIQVGRQRASSEPGGESRTESRRVLSWDRTHPSMLDLDLSGLRYRNRVGIDGEAIALDRDGAVIGEAAESGVRHIQIGFALEDSNWGVQVSMPMFFSNTVRYLLPGTSGSGVIHQTGGAVNQVGLGTIDDEPVGYALLDRVQTLRAGSSLQEMSAQDGPLNLAGGNSPGRVELWRWFVLAGLLVLTIEWILDLMRRRIV